MLLLGLLKLLFVIFFILLIAGVIIIFSAFRLLGGVGKTIFGRRKQSTTGAGSSVGAGVGSGRFQSRPSRPPAQSRTGDEGEYVDYEEVE